MRLPVHIYESSKKNGKNTSKHQQLTKSHKQNASNIVPVVKVESPLEPLEHDYDAGKGEQA
jgi:hypothetical protein